MNMSVSPIIFIVGPTASGKTGVAIEAAIRYDGEVICADSRTVYRYMNIGTAKPTKDEMAGVRHWGLNLVDPNERFSVGQYKAYVDQVIKDIQSRGKLPIVVGGSGLYVDAVLYDYQLLQSHDESLRKVYQQMTVEELIKYSNDHNIELPKNHKNKRHLVRAIETGGPNKQIDPTPIPGSIVVGISTNREELLEKIQQRIDQMIDQNVVEETSFLIGKFGADLPVMKGNIYEAVSMYLRGEVSLGKAKDLAFMYDKRLVKKQRTWFKRNQSINWVDMSEVVEYLRSALRR